MDRGMRLETRSEKETKGNQEELYYKETTSERETKTVELTLEDLSVLTCNKALWRQSSHTLPHYASGGQEESLNVMQKELKLHL